MKNNPTSRLPNDRLALAAMLLAGATVFCLLTVLLVIGLTLLRPDVLAAAACRQFVGQYSVHAIALMPPGQYLRLSDGRRPDVDLRYDPRLPMDNPDAGLVFLPQPTRYLSPIQAPEKGQPRLNEGQ